LVIIFALVLMVNPQKLVESFKDVNQSYILLVIILYVLNVLTKSFRWYLLVNSTGTKVGYIKTLPFFIIALAFNNLTPGKVGGEPVRAYLLKKEANVPIGQGIASIFSEKILDLIVITSMAVIGAIFILPLLDYNEARFLVILLITAVSGIIITLIIVSHSTMLKRTLDKSVNLAMRVSNRGFVKRLSLAMVGFVEKFRFGMGRILKARKTAGVCIILTVVIWINEALRLFLILLAMPEVETVSIGAVFIASSIANIFGIILPLGAGNILGIGAVFIAVGMASNDATAASFLQVATSLWISVPLGVLAMLVTGFKISSITDNGLENNNNNNNNNNNKNNNKATDTETGKYIKTAEKKGIT
jgi:uncharacterized protein (TIRG00374 family)